VFLLPTAARCYRPREFARELHEIDITRWHRWRLLAGFAARSLVARIRRAAAP
jgi:hypothetical protein